MNISQAPLGAIVDTNSKGRYDLLVYSDGILAVRGTYVGVALRSAGVGMVGAGGGGIGGAATAGAGAAAGEFGGKSYEDKRLDRVLGHSRDEIAKLDSNNFFVGKEQITGVVLRKRWHGCSLILKTVENPGGRRFSWKPALNRFQAVREVVAAAFGPLVVEE